MTELHYVERPRWRQTEVPYRGGKVRAICVALQPTTILLRLKGTR
jgi:hypothetical protein